jgi:hypothetical protein
MPSCTFILPAPSSLDPGLPIELDAIILKALEKDRGLRAFHGDLLSLRVQTQDGGSGKISCPEFLWSYP